MANLYRHFDKDGRLLYVGISLSAMDRMRQHKCKSSWFPEIANMTIQVFPNKKEAINAEREAIINEKPLHNIRGTKEHKAKEKKIMEVNKSAKSWREMKGWSQAHLANVLTKKLGRTIRQSHISEWENGTTTPADVGEVMKKLSAGRITYIKGGSDV